MGKKKIYEIDMESFSKALNNTGICIFAYYPKTRSISVSKLACETFHCEESYNNMPESFAEAYVYEEDYSVFYELYARINKGEKTATAEFRSKDLAFKTRVTLTTILTDADSNPEDVLGIIENRTEELYKDKMISAMTAEIERGRDFRRELEHTANHDHLTGLLNRSGYEKVIEKFMEEEEQIGYMNLDIDNFKEVNDTYGHEMGDSVLKKIAKLLKRHFRVSDFVFRFGGDEFVVLLHKYQKNQMRFILKKIQNINDELKNPQDDTPVVSLSAGVCLSKSKDFEMLYRIADEALYHTKENGRCGCTIYNDRRELLDEQHDTISMSTQLIKREILQNSYTGVWRIVVEDEEKKKIYVDEVAKELVGLHMEPTPEEKYGYWVNRIDKDYIDLVKDAAKMAYEKGSIEVTYLWNHPYKGKRKLRCSAIVDRSVKEGNQLYGFFQDITDACVMNKRDENHLVMTAMNSIYFCNYYISLREGTYTEPNHAQNRHQDLGVKGDIKKVIATYLERLVMPQDYAKMKEFLNLDTLPQRLEKQEYIECEYLSNSEKGWCRARFLPVKWDENKRLTHVTYLVNSIHREKSKQLELEKNQQFFMNLTRQMFCRFLSVAGTIDIETEKIIFFNLDEENQIFEKIREYDYNTLRIEEAQGHICKADKERFLSGTSLSYIKEMTNKESVYKICVQRYMDDSKYIRYMYQFAKSRENENHILFVAEARKEVEI